MKPDTWELKNGTYAGDEPEDTPQDALAPAQGVINTTMVSLALWGVAGLLIIAMLLLGGGKG